MSTNNPQFSPVDMIKESWVLVQANAGPLIGAFVLTVVISIAAGSIPLLGFPIHFAITGPLQFGLYSLSIAAVRKQTVDFQLLFSGFQRYVPTFVAGLLISIFSIIGYAFCVIPGVLVMVLYLPTYLYMLDDGLDFWPAMEKSRLTVMDNFGQWLLLFFALAVLNFVGFLACGVGCILTGPMSILVVCMAYEMQRRASGPPSISTATYADPAAE